MKKSCTLAICISFFVATPALAWQCSGLNPDCEKVKSQKLEAEAYERHSQNLRLQPNSWSSETLKLKSTYSTSFQHKRYGTERPRY